MGEPLKVRLLPSCAILSEWLAKAQPHLPPFKVKPKKGFVLFVEFDCCPFKENHDHGAYIGQKQSGEIVAGCQVSAKHPDAWRWHDLVKLVRKSTAAEKSAKKGGRR